MRENKAARRPEEIFAAAPTFTGVKLFLEIAAFESPKERGERLDALPKNHAESDAFVILNAYHLAKAEEFSALRKCALMNDDMREEKLYRTALSSLITAIDKEKAVFETAVELLREAVYVTADAEKRAFLTGAVGHMFIERKIRPFADASGVAALKGKSDLFDKMSALYVGAPVTTVRTGRSSQSFNPDHLNEIYDGQQDET